MTPFQFRPATRADVPLLIGVAGGTGSGKTMSALKVARGLAGDKPLAAIDTESGRARMYADYCQPWHHGDLTAPFTPARYGDAITAAEKAGYPVIVIDSFSHEHAGDGGLLDMHEAELQRMAGNDARKRDAVKMAAWINPKGEHKKLVSRLLQLRAHVIVCLRAEEKIEVVKDERGKTVVRPKQTLTGISGWVPVCEKSLPFELTMSLLLTADQPGVPKPIKLNADHRPFVPLDRPLSEQVGAALARWARGDAADRPAPLATLPAETVAALQAAKKEAGVDDAWMRARLAEIGVDPVPERVTVAAIRSLTQEQADALAAALNAMVDERVEF